MEPLKRSTSQWVDQAANDLEPIHFIAQIQPYGVLLAIEESTLNILWISENTQEYFGVSPESLPGQPLSQLLDRSTLIELTTALDSDDLEAINPFAAKLNAQLDRSLLLSSTFLAAAHRTDQVIILELEPLLSCQISPSDELYRQLKRAIANIKRASTLSELYQNVAREIRRLTEFDRVMVYRFDADYSGIVVAEDRRTGLESYLGLHYPAADIPTTARSIFIGNWLRTIPNVNDEPVTLLSWDKTNSPLDLSRAMWRGVSPCHREYLRNMGVTATMTISLIDGDRLWGLIACHHDTPKLLGYQTRKTCELLGQLVSLELVLQQEREWQHYRERYS